MKERPILLKGEMVRAILEGRKTQTRRIIKPQPEAGIQFGAIAAPHGVLNGNGNPLICRYGKPGDRLWVRETWCAVDDTELEGERWVDYRATPRYSSEHPAGWENAPDDPEALKWRPSIHMPRWASRILLEITDVRVGRLQDISEEDAEAEGCYPKGMHPDCGAVNRFCRLWRDINGENSWDANPWVWVIEFKRIEAENRAAA